ncbi:MAG: DUF1194 domain-containing protein [Kiloniellaceae bacterium]
MRLKFPLFLPVVLAAVLCGILSSGPARAVDLALVLLNDVSQSMDDGEFALVKDGYRAAFADPEVIAALIANGSGVAVAYVEFSGKDDVKRVLDWQVLTDAASARAFGEAVAAAPRSSAGNTALSAGLAAAIRMLLDSDFDAARQVGDIASDHPHDGGRCEPIRDAAVAAGITIYALPIIDERQIGTIDGRLAYTESRWGSESIVDFYLRTVVGGPGSFVVEARDYRVFGEALKRKLLLEFIASPERDRAAFTVAAADD